MINWIRSLLGLCPHDYSTWSDAYSHSLKDEYGATVDVLRLQERHCKICNILEKRVT